MRAFLGAGACSVLLSVGASVAAQPSAVLLERQTMDADDLYRLEKLRPAAAENVKQGEVALSKGNTKQALELFKKASAEATESELASRRECQALTELHQRREALAACSRALRNGRSAMTFRAAVAAMPIEPPSTDELALALTYSEEAKRRMPDQPIGYAIDCDIAERLGDETMLRTCKTDLERVAPGHYETLRASSLVAAHGTPAWVSLGWLAMAGGALGTLVHALRNRMRRPSPGAGVAALLFATAALLSPAVASANEPPAYAQPGGFSKWPISDQDPSSSVPTPEQRDGNPLEFGYHLMDLNDKAEIAINKGDFRQAAKYYVAMVKAVPDAPTGYRKACENFEKDRDLVKAIEYCRGALGQKGVTVGDYRHYAELVLADPSPLTKERQQDISEIIPHLRQTEGGADLAAELDCELGLRLRDSKRLETCTKALALKAPNDPKTITYQWAFAIQREDFGEARTLIERARKTAMKPEGIQKMEQTTTRESAVMRRLGRNWRPLLGIVLGAGLLAGGAGFLASRRRARVPAAQG